MSYSCFIDSKSLNFTPSGFNPDDKTLNKKLFPFQSDIVTWALKRGKAAIFADCGMGKTFMQLEWAKQVVNKTNKPVLILAPYAVCSQTIDEAKKFGLTVNDARYDVSNNLTGLNITNYERLHQFEDVISQFSGIVLDESSIIKSYDGKYRNQIIEYFKTTPYKLACTATPAPNDYKELGSHSEFLGSMSQAEMLSMFFINDVTHTGDWRLKGHAISKFWEWVSSWAVMIRKPSDLNYEDGDFILPPIEYKEHIIEMGASQGFLIPMLASTLQERIQASRESIQQRVEFCANLVNQSNDPWVVWCNLNDESKLLTELIPDAVEVKGSDSPELKSKRLNGFANGEFRVLVSKPKIAGFGMNWQHCNNMAFVGLNDSYEQLYQAVRRCWRFGQTKPVTVHIISAETEGNVISNIKRKDAESEKMASEMVKNMRKQSMVNIKGLEVVKSEYKPQAKIVIPEFLGV